MIIFVAEKIMYKQFLSHTQTHPLLGLTTLKMVAPTRHDRPSLTVFHSLHYTHQLATHFYCKIFYVSLKIENLQEMCQIMLEAPADSLA